MTLQGVFTMRYDNEAADDLVTLRMCPSCYGARKISCATCQGRQVDRQGVSCGKCLGSGRMTCVSCDGQGRIRV